MPNWYVPGQTFISSKSVFPFAAACDLGSCPAPPRVSKSVQRQTVMTGRRLQTTAFVPGLSAPPRTCWDPGTTSEALSSREWGVGVGMKSPESLRSFQNHSFVSNVLSPYGQVPDPSILQITTL